MSSNIQALIRVRNNNRNNIIVGTNLQLEVRSHPFFFIILFIQFDQNCFIKIENFKFLTGGMAS